MQLCVCVKFVFFECVSRKKISKRLLRGSKDKNYMSNHIPNPNTHLLFLLVQFVSFQNFFRGVESLSSRSLKSSTLFVFLIRNLITKTNQKSITKNLTMFKSKFQPIAIHLNCFFVVIPIGWECKSKIT